MIVLATAEPRYVVPWYTVDLAAWIERELSWRLIWSIAQRQMQIRTTAIHQLPYHEQPQLIMYEVRYLVTDQEDCL
jgi:hypothetical protein